jgi:hypothetical protein
MQRRSLFKRLGAAAIAAPLALAAASTSQPAAAAVVPAPPVPPGFAPSNLGIARLVAQQHQHGLVSRADYLAGFPSYTRDEPKLAAILAGLDLRAIQRQAGCPDGCTLRFLGESLLEPVYLFRHERFADGQVAGGDIAIDSVLDPVRSDPAHLSAHIVKRLRAHHIQAEERRALAASRRFRERAFTCDESPEDALAASFVCSPEGKAEIMKLAAELRGDLLRQQPYEARQFYRSALGGVVSHPTHVGPRRPLAPGDARA